MKKFIVLISVLALLVPVRMSAQFNVAAGVSVGMMDGAGVSVAAGVLDNLNIRAGYSLVPSSLIKEYGIDLPKWGSNPASSTAVTGKLPSSGNILVDYHPGGGSFRLTAGAFFGSSDLVRVFNTEALPDSYHSAGVSYYVDGDTEDVSKFYRIMSDAKGIMTGYVKTGAVRPFVGIGFGSAVPKGRVGATIDFGAEYTGGMDISADAVNIKGEKELITLTSAGVKKTVQDMRGSADKSYDKYIDYVDKLSSLPVLPMLRVSIFVKIF